MKISFSETMSGNLTASDGSHDVSFTVRADDEGRGYFRLSGHATAAPWVSEAPAEGVLLLSPRFLRYRVSFPGPDGRWVLAGEKRPSLRHPLRSMVTLPIQLTDGHGALRASGDLRFDLADLPRFALSWVPGARLLVAV